MSKRKFFTKVVLSLILLSFFAILPLIIYLTLDILASFVLILIIILFCVSIFLVKKFITFFRDF